MQLKYRTVNVPGGVANCTDVFDGECQSRLAGHLTEAQVKQTIAVKNQRAAYVQQVTS